MPIYALLIYTKNAKTDMNPGSVLLPPWRPT